LTLPHLPCSPLFPYTTLFRSGQVTDNVLSGSPAARVSGNAIDDDGFINGGGTLSYRVREQSGAWSSWLNVTGSHSSGRVDFNFEDRKSTRLNSSHVKISNAVF